jgi:hypothetical protein
MCSDLASLFRRGHRRWTVIALILLGLVARIPGVFWGTNFPLDGFGEHHPDERTHVLVDCSHEFESALIRRVESA